MPQLYSAFQSALTTYGTSQFGVYNELTIRADTYNCFNIVNCGVNDDGVTQGQVEIQLTASTSVPSTSSHGVLLNVNDSLKQENINPYYVWCMPSTANVAVLVEEYLKK